MKKTLIAAAVMAASGVAFAASNVTLYGVMDGGVVVSKAKKEDTKVQAKSGFNSGSRWGLKGVEELGNGYTVGFQLEQGFNLDDGMTANGWSTEDGEEGTFNRESRLYVAGSFGSLSFGRFGSLASGAGSQTILTGWQFGTSYEETGSWTKYAKGNGRINNAISYVSPSFAGMTVHVMYSNGTKKNSGKWANAPEYGLAKKGVLCLQDHGYPASFRNLKIKELPRKTGKEVNLFNGVDLTGWEPYGTEKWYVKDGLLVCESGPDKQYGYLATRDYYDDFDLTVEFKQEADGNSGVFIRSFVEEGVKVNGWQVEVAPKGHDTGGIYESYGRGWLVQIPDEKENILKEGDWNTMRIKVQGDNVQTWLNGQEMVNLNDEKIGAGKGRIALQIHDGGGIKVLWRNLKLTTL